MNITIALGALGFVIGALIGFIIDRTPPSGLGLSHRETPRMAGRFLNNILGICVGAGVMYGLRVLAPDQPVFGEFWLYPAGLAGGLLFGLMFNRVA